MGQETTIQKTLFTNCQHWCSKIGGGLKVHGVAMVFPWPQQTYSSKNTTPRRTNSNFMLYGTNNPTQGNVPLRLYTPVFNSPIKTKHFENQAL